MDAFSFLRGRIYSEMDADLSCKEDLEMTEGVKNEFYEGTLEAYGKVLIHLEEVEKIHMQHQLLEKYKRSLT